MGMRGLALVILGFVVGAAVFLLAEPGTNGSSTAASIDLPVNAAPGASTAADGHAHSHGGTGAGNAVLDGSTPCEQAGAAGGEGSTGNGGSAHGHRGFFAWTAMDRASRDAMTQQLATAHQVTLEMPTVANAEAAGYRLTTGYIPCIGAHYINAKYLRAFDPTHPAMLLYDGSAPDSRIVGLSYAQMSGDEAPEGFAGPNDLWHQHNLNGGLCLKNGVVVGGESTNPEDCKARGGIKVALDSLWMMHAWVADGWPSAWGIFSAEHPDLGGIPGDINAEPGATTSAAANR
jgi:hypothetical protein